MKYFIIASRTNVSIPQINFLNTTIKQMHYRSVVLLNSAFKQDLFLKRRVRAEFFHGYIL